MSDFKRRFALSMLVCLVFALAALLLAAGLTRSAARADEAAPISPRDDPPEVDGIPLDQTHVETFDVGGESKSVTIWYTLDKTPMVVDVDPGPETNLVTRTHGLDDPAQAEYGGELAREAWETYYRIFHRSPRNTGPNCEGNIDVWVFDTSPWPSSAPWPAREQDCRIVILVNELRNDPRYAFQHEFFHYLQFAYDDGCYEHMANTYSGNIWHGTAGFTEGYADLAVDIVTQGMDDLGFPGFVKEHRHWRSIYHEGYWNLFTKYLAEQLGSEWTAADPEYHMDAVRGHYEACDAQDTLYVLEDLVLQLSGGELTKEELVLNFFAANYAYAYVDFATHPELFYVDHGTPNYGPVRYIEKANLTDAASWHGDFILTKQEDGDYNNWLGDIMPDALEPNPQEWAAHYYQVVPQFGCDYVTAAVDGEPGARLGISLIGLNANPNVADYFQRFAWIGQGLTRTFHRRSSNFPVTAIVNSFDSMHEFDVSFECVSPEITILEPRRRNMALVGPPESPGTFFLRFAVLSDGSAVRGLADVDVEIQVDGQTASLVDGTFQEVGEEYWAVVEAPAADPGTTWADVDVILSGDVAGTEAQAVLYVDPGHTDTVLLFDASGSMDTEDVLGEGKRYENAKKAGTIVADLLRDGDRVSVMDFSASGGYDPTYDIRTLLVLTEVTVPGTIDDAKDAIDLISPRYQTPIGQALLDAKDALTSVTGGENPQNIVLLSDGEENVSPRWDAVEDEIVASGVVVDTIAFSDEADPELMLEIAAKTGGTYRYVPTSGGTQALLGPKSLEALETMGLPAVTVPRVTAAARPGPLGLDEVYDYYETKNQGAERLFLQYWTAAKNDEYKTVTQYVDNSVTELRFVVASAQPHGVISTFRQVEILPPDATEWVVISGIMGPDPLPGGWSVRESTYDHVVVIHHPDSGEWGLRAKGTVWNQRQMSSLAGFDFMFSGSGQTEVRLHGRFLPPLVGNKGSTGDHVPIVATLLNDEGGVSGANVVATIEGPSATSYVLLKDDGNHGDGSADDGIYGGLFSATDAGGSYNVRVVAAWQEGDPGDWLTREWTGGFWLRGVERASDDTDGDQMPNWWEEEHGLNPTINDALGDLDLDGLKNIHELQVGSRPNQTDTDHGGENDYSEAQQGRDPADPDDDQVEHMGQVTTMIYNGTVVIYWPYATRFSNVQLWVSTDPEEKGGGLDIGTTGVYTLTGLTNDQTYYLRFVPVGLDGVALGELTPALPVFPKADPDAPNGAVWINGGASSTTSRDVTLTLIASDIPLDGPSAAASGAVANHTSRALNEISGGVEMKISNDGSFASTDWEPYSFTKAWTLGDPEGGVFQVYAQFRDAAGNESLVVWDRINDAGTIYLPVVFRSI